MTAHSLNTPEFYLTAPAPCPYLPGRTERKVFTHLVGERAPLLHEALTGGGFRRSQSIAYRPACFNCRLCVPTRVLADQFRPTRNMRRIVRRNDDLIGQDLPNSPTSEQHSLFRRYIESRHGEGGMTAMTVLDFAMMMEDSHVDTRIIEYRARGADSGITGRGEGDLIAVMLYDRLASGLSLVYSFFDPGHEKRSLGTFLILDMISRTRREGLPHCHLGYWVEGSQKMEYKARFHPQQRLTGTGWKTVEQTA
ncbi:MAG: arginyltransferase [Ahrensia sp.]|nr:arginyltransferase [Ahrensia sp.]